ncbi:hypothetical protein B0A54_07338 [Friedmanniomyces endolithicus]|uniref:Uncharacterized protein n=1 Tax=Friedmanniomyces endolithicus TaxID=329885 RepID=A0A4U0V0Z2_9PEZI|nr:hypothetical protein LTS09_007741 [Friedmanniomyces endolithicus]TKA42250.1 hypothetical protein B0A54_07338 [Friedmanniomyces endolithicus]
MSSDSLAMFRKSMGPDLAKLAEQHLQHDLTQADRDALQTAARTVSTHVTAGSLLGLALSTLLAYRLRRARLANFAAFSAREKPVALRFPSGREEPIPDVTALLRPSTVGDIATYGLLGFGGLFLGGETGLLTGGFRARQGISREGGGRERIQGAFRKFQADALRKQAEALERGGGGGDGGWSL